MKKADKMFKKHFVRFVGGVNNPQFYRESEKVSGATNKTGEL